MNNEQQLTNILDAEIPPDCDVYHQFVHCVNACMRRCGFTRAGLATRMNQALKVLEVEVDEAKLNKWFAPSQPNHMPIHYLPALCWATKSMEPVNILLSPLMFKAFDQRAQLLQKHAEMEMQKQQIEKSQQEILNSITIPTDQ
ncbi:MULTISPECIES: hypothetical protein [Pseudoalteromonas]|uniref:Phage protein n=1 Tax=Pseudoalteromonas amylolytica TaxID=1859457 RepID=A0A1S1MXS6_9GAMM|nr:MULTISPECIES: hypothetical protein [Pseudoalteromonas]OHU85507.1 hypothetical protein BFC16_19355 [Pseudoalteromonas sp. JW3]OHU91741.1 hypothetical protein BET10_08050 [Pseudoalteromonas amylolytica]